MSPLFGAKFAVAGAARRETPATSPPATKSNKPAPIKGMKM